MSRAMVTGPSPPYSSRWKTRMGPGWPWLVLGNEAPGGRCPFFGRQCRHCDIGAGEGTRFSPQMNRARLEGFRRQYGAALSKVRHLVLYNSGSVLNPQEMSPETLARVLGFEADLPRCRVVSPRRSGEFGR